MRISEPRAIASLDITPWKNGGGSTRVLAVEPPDAGLDDFRWRISFAEVNRSGAFSIFPDVDRTILLWGGEGLLLRAASWTHSLDELLVPFAFRGEDEISCDLVDGPTTDLNVMVRRGAVHTTVDRYDHEIALSCPAETLIVLCVSGIVHIQPGNVILSSDHFVRIDECADITLTPSAAGATFLIIAQHEAVFGI